MEHVCTALRALLWAGRYLNPWNARLEMLRASAIAVDPAVPHLQSAQALLRQQQQAAADGHTVTIPVPHPH